MSLSISKDNQSTVLAGLGTYIFTCPTSDIYSISCFTTMVPPSGLSILLKHNTSTVASFSSPAAQQQYIELNSGPLTCSSSDTLSVVITSFSAIDQQLNTVKSIIAIDGPGNQQGG